MIGITGHTAGLGKALFERFSPDAVGFSRANGYDISCQADREEIVRCSSECGVFINNAHSGFHQVDLLYAIHAAWQTQNKTIINISSNSGDGIKPFPHKYAIQKSALDKASEQLSRQGACRILNLRPGYINTDRVKEIDQPKIPVEDIVDLIDTLLKLPAHMHVSNITVLPR
jgi:NADP-dependent 3-hydroxy acid dehydrogenase YdfG